MTKQVPDNTGLTPKKSMFCTGAQLWSPEPSTSLLAPLKSITKDINVNVNFIM
jgi:hypothetical protein